MTDKRIPAGVEMRLGGESPGDPFGAVLIGRNDIFL